MDKESGLGSMRLNGDEAGEIRGGIELGFLGSVYFCVSG